MIERLLKLRVASRCPRPGGFTLIEVLLVMAIVVVLLGLILPLVLGALGQAKGMQCLVNLRELNRCIKQYYRDNHNTWPPMQATGRNERLLEEMAEQEGLTLSEARHAGGYHWSLVLWPYHRDIRYYTCPCDPAIESDDPFPDGVPRGSPFADAPPESYALNTLLFRSMAKIRQRSGASWGLDGRTFQTPLMFTALKDQRRTIPNLNRRILMCCGAAGFPVGHQSNVVWRDRGLGPANRRTEWHHQSDAEAFEDDPATGSYYLFFDGAVEYRKAFPSRFEWALDLR
jgi:prepilin-type N-terminal cleavage/methylation domain-containing protein